MQLGVSVCCMSYCLEINVCFQVLADHLTPLAHILHMTSWLFPTDDADVKRLQCLLIDWVSAKLVTAAGKGAWSIF